MLIGASSRGWRCTGLFGAATGLAGGARPGPLPGAGVRRRVL